MYKGNNTIALKSRQWLVEALLSLIIEEPYNKITIRKICEKSDLSRQTFYNFFEHKDDIIRFWFKERYEVILNNYEASKDLEINDLTIIFSDFLESNSEILKCLIDQGLENIIADEIAESIPLFASKIIDKVEKTDTCKYINAFLSGALTQTIICWFKDEKKLSRAELSDLLSNILSGNYYN